jgi:EmrB/QacA subfamily drug resistance transporter
VRSSQAALRSRWTFAAVSTALFCVQIDYFAMNLALPRMAQDLGSDTTNLQWVISVYMLALGAFMTPAGRIGDIFGRRRALLAGVALFGVASVLCALAPSAGTIIAFRALQGLGAALIFPVSVSVLTNAFPAQRASQAIGMAYGIAGLGNAAGPLIGGLLTESFGWRSIFWLNVPFTVLSLVIGAICIDDSSDTTVPRRIDVAGLALIVFGVGLFTLTFDRGSAWGWTSPATLAAFVISVLLLAAFVVVERRVRWPLVDLSLIRNAKFTILVVAGTIANIAYAVTIYLSTMNLQLVRELDPLTAGLAFLGPSAGAALGGVLSGWLAARRPPVQVMGAGCAAAAVSLAALSASTGWVAYLIAHRCGYDAGAGVCVHDSRNASGGAPGARRRGSGRHAHVDRRTRRCGCGGLRHGDGDSVPRRLADGLWHRLDHRRSRGRAATRGAGRAVHRVGARSGADLRKRKRDRSLGLTPIGYQVGRGVGTRTGVPIGVEFAAGGGAAGTGRLAPVRASTISCWMMLAA